MDDLIAFMQARIAEDAKRWQRIWRAFRGDRRIGGGWDGWGPLGHLVSACVDPTRGGRETAAKRKRLELYVQARDELRAFLAGKRAHLDAKVFARELNRAHGCFLALETAVRLDAYVYADHADYADYDERWKLDA